MELRTYRHAWGAVGPTGRFGAFSDFLPEVKTRGYDGIELAPIVFDVMPQAYGSEGPERLRELLVEHDLELVPMVMTFGSTWDEHAEQFARQLEHALSWDPRLVVAHTGADSLDESGSSSLLERCVSLAAEAQVRVAHETHRGRVLSTPWRTACMLDRVPGLWLKADYSHFVCSAERLLDDAEDVMAALCERVIHTDARVGFENGPQVPDPRHPRWRQHRTAFEGWWDQIWRAANGRGEPWTALTPEYGPATYAPLDMDAEVLWSVCEWAADTARERFRSRTWQPTPDSVDGHRP